MSKAANPFQYVAAINTKDVSEISGDGYSGYIPFIINRNFGNFKDTVLLANELNGFASELPKSLQFLFLYNTVRQGKRWSKWDKPDEEDRERLEAVMNHYIVSEKVARGYMVTLDAETLDSLVEFNKTKKQVR